MSRRVGWLASRQACWGLTAALTPLECDAEQVDPGERMLATAVVGELASGAD